MILTRALKYNRSYQVKRVWNKEWSMDQRRPNVNVNAKPLITAPVYVHVVIMI